MELDTHLSITNYLLSHVGAMYETLLKWLFNNFLDLLSRELGGCWAERLGHCRVRWSDLEAH
ncbi:hypothetical protein GCM10028807_52870 [Spirosoma daeguense]